MDYNRQRGFSSGNKAKRSIALALAACIVLMMTGCTTYNSFRQTFGSSQQDEAEPSITIGVIEPQSGRNAQKGKDEIKGIELANSIYNNVDGYKVQLARVDTQSSVSATETAIQALIEMKPVAIIGAAGDASSLAITDYIDKAGIPTITPSATNPLITQNSSYYFRACLTESQMGEGLAEYAYNEVGSRNIAVVSIKNDTSAAALMDGFDDRIKKLAVKRSNAVVVTEEITPSEDEMKQALRKIRNANADVCLVSMGTEEMDTFFALAEGMALEGITYLGTKSWGDASFAAMMEKHPDIKKVVFPYESVLTKNDDTSDTYTEEAQRFQIEYAGRYGSDDIPTDNAALGYDSYLVLINAIHSAKSLEGTDIRAAMRA
ncbi:MAG: ABC transporter substrate-binding protein, partial [Mogibacterium sp.]|nr:ABC transporter substrate-binding protein [Mogibacterium sp.]